MKRTGFTLIELAIVILLVGISAAYMVLSPEIARQPAKKEAERIAFFLNNIMRKADIRKHEFMIHFPLMNNTLSYDIAQFFYIAWRCSDSETGDNIIKVNDSSKKYKLEKNPFTLTSSCNLRTNQKNIEYSNFTYTNVEDGISLLVRDSKNETYQVLVNKYGMVGTKE